MLCDICGEAYPPHLLDAVDTLHICVDCLPDYINQKKIEKNLESRAIIRNYCKEEFSKLLIIKNVDLDELDNQRKHLAAVMTSVTSNDGATITLKRHQIRALDGILNMLDVWSDKRANNID